ncbi:MAG: STAS domain-containing protein [Bryobacterales bacterium]|nr:STAS domain-containing protein [Bryobacterales bacterium]
MPFEMARTEDESGVAVLTLTGTLTMGSQLERLEASVAELIGKGQLGIVLDLAQVSYLDSSAIGTLIGCNNTVKKAGGRLRLAGVTERVKKILEMTGVDAVLPLDANAGASVAALRAGTGEA